LLLSRFQKSYAFLNRSPIAGLLPEGARALARLWRATPSAKNRVSKQSFKTEFQKLSVFDRETKVFDRRFFCFSPIPPPLAFGEKRGGGREKVFFAARYSLSRLLRASGSSPQRRESEARRGKTEGVQTQRDEGFWAVQSRSAKR